MTIKREIRFSLLKISGAHPPCPNSYAGWPVSDSIAPFLILRVTVSGFPDAKTGMICNVHELDQKMQKVVPILTNLYKNAGSLSYSQAILHLTSLMQENTPKSARLYSAELQVSPWLTFTCIPGGLMIRISRSYEFSAAHRLHCQELSTERNRELFGKCNHTGGHGHNYKVDISVEGEPDQQTGMLIPIETLDEFVMQHVIQYFDHKHLNTDCVEFAARNPTVEMIAETIRTRLEQVLPVRLQSVRVWETEKTCAESILR